MEDAVQNVAPSGRRSRSESIESVETNVKRVFLPTIIAGWISGFGIIEYPLGHPRLHISILYASFVHGLLLIGSLYDIYLNLLQFEGNINLFVGLFYIYRIMSVIFLFYTVILYWTNQKKIKSCLRRFAEIKMEINQLNRNENDDRGFRLQKNQILIIIIALLFQGLQTITFMLQTPKAFSITDVIYIIIIELSLFASSVNDIIFINYVTFVKWEFAVLNEKMTELFSALEEKLSMEDSSDSLEDDTQDYCGLIKTTRRLHLHLAKLSRSVNNVFGIPILLSLILSTVFFIFCLYNLYITVKGLISGNGYMVDLIYHFMWLAFVGREIFIINLACARTIDEAHEIKYVIMKFNIEAINKRMELETRLFTLQRLQNPVTFTANGFFDLGHSFILLVIGVIVAYMSILIQSDNSSINFDLLKKTFSNSTT